MHYQYKTKNTCSTEIEFDMDEKGVVTGVGFHSGCDGNLKAIASLVEGSTAEDIISRCAGIQCGRRPTSCADQLATALREAKESA